jgi:tRNA modification GTPase
MLIDTAGIREVDDPVEREGVRRARDRAASADLVLWLEDSEGDSPRIIGESAATLWRVRTKVDLLDPKSDAANPGQLAANLGQGRCFAISASRGDGVDELVVALTSFADAWFGTGETAAITRLRHRNILRDAAASLAKAVNVGGQGEELIAEELRISIHLLGRLLGRIDIEDVLDSIFRDFCIGK